MRVRAALKPAGVCVGAPAWWAACGGHESAHTHVCARAMRTAKMFVQRVGTCALQRPSLRVVVSVHSSEPALVHQRICAYGGRVHGNG
jgi:hypothetical protein